MPDGRQTRKLKRSITASVELLLRNRGEHLGNVLRFLPPVLSALLAMGATFNIVFVRVSPAPDKPVSGFSESLEIAEEVWRPLVGDSWFATAIDAQTIRPPWEIIPLQARNLEGSLLLLGGGYAWRYESSTTLSVPDSAGPRTLSSREVLDLIAMIGPALEASGEVIALGMASCTTRDALIEDRRAADRANQLRGWLAQAQLGLARLAPVTSMNLGVHSGPCATDDTLNRQQRVVAFLLLPKEHSRPSTLALWELLSSCRRSGFEPSSYSRFRS